MPAMPLALPRTALIRFEIGIFILRGTCDGAILVWYSPRSTLARTQRYGKHRPRNWSAISRNPTPGTASAPAHHLIGFQVTIRSPLAYWIVAITEARLVSRK